MACKATGYLRASKFINVTLDPPGKRAGDVKLQAPRTSYGSRRSRVARRGKRKFNRPRVDTEEGYTKLRTFGVCNSTPFYYFSGEFRVLVSAVMGSDRVLSLGTDVVIEVVRMAPVNEQFPSLMDASYDRGAPHFFPRFLNLGA